MLVRDGDSFPRCHPAVGQSGGNLRISVAKHLENCKYDNQYNTTVNIGTKLTHAHQQV